MSKKLITLALALAIVFSTNTAFAFNDVTSTTDYSEAIQALSDENVIVGYPDGTFKPARTVNRAEIVKMALMLGNDVDLNEIDTDTTLKDCFPDVTDQWFAKYVCYAKNKELVQGDGDGLFHPEREVNLAEASKIATNTAQYSKSAVDTYDTKSSNDTLWYRPYVDYMDLNSYLPPTLKEIDQKLNRGEVAEILWRQRMINYAHELEGSRFDWDGDDSIWKFRVAYSYNLYDGKVYYGNEELVGADPDTFEYIDSGLFKDANNVYLSGEILEEADVSNFANDLNYFWGKDGLVYIIAPYSDEVKLVADADPDTFQTYERYFAIDANNVYDYRGEVVEGLDAPTFEILDHEVKGVDGGLVYAKDKNSVYIVWYWEGAHITKVEGADPASFEVIADGVWKDTNNVYFLKDVIEGVDKDKFEYSGMLTDEQYYVFFFKDFLNDVYYYGITFGDYENLAYDEIGIFANADPWTFEVLDVTFAQDMTFEYTLVDGVFTMNVHDYSQ